MKLQKYLAAIMLLALMLAGSAHAGQWMDIYAQAVIADVNAERASRGLGTLRPDAALTAAARVRALEIAEKFSHTRPDGSRWKTVSAHALSENIARGQKTPDKVMAAWMSSPDHRAAVIRESYGSIGVACVKIGGVYHWVQLFGK